MTERTKPGRGSDRTKHSGASIKPTSRSVFSIDGVPIDQIYSSIKAEKPDVHLAPAAADSGGVEMADPPGARVPGGHGGGDVEEPGKVPASGSPQGLPLVASRWSARRRGRSGCSRSRTPPTTARSRPRPSAAQSRLAIFRSIGRASRSGSTKPTSSGISPSSDQVVITLSP
jgi:hypothetical protein